MSNPSLTELEIYINSYFGISKSEKLYQVSDLFKLTTLQKGDFFLKENQRCDKLSFIKNGLLRIYATKDGKEITQWISTKGYFVTDISSFMFETPARWTIQALVDTEVYTIKRNDYKKIQNIEPQWFEFEKMFIVKCFEMVENRVFNHLSMSAEERYNIYFKANKDIFNQVPLHYIASLLGMSPETLSRIRKKQLDL